MISFESDYNNGMLPEILENLSKTNDDKTSGYGFDPYSESAKKKIRKAIGNEEADVFFLIGGTQTNTTVIDSLLLGCEGVICVETGHIEVHESGAVEAFGHKVLTIPSTDSKLKAADLADYMETFLGDETHPHMVQPGMVYISLPTELGMVYSKEELAELYSTCQKYQLRLFIDGARLGYGLMSEACEYDLPYVAEHCDVFYIGGTKVGAMFGEAVVFSGMKAPKYFFTNVKRHGALLAKEECLAFSLTPSLRMAYISRFPSMPLIWLLLFARYLPSTTYHWLTIRQQTNSLSSFRLLFIRLSPSLLLSRFGRRRMSKR